MNKWNDISVICQQAKVDSRYKSKLETRLAEHGFIPVDHYFKRVNENSVDYLFVERLNKRPLDETEQKFEDGTYHFEIRKDDAEYFENAISQLNEGVFWPIQTGAIGGVWGSQILVVIADIIAHAKFDSDVSNAFYPLAAIAGTLFGARISRDYRANKAANKITKDYLPNVEMSKTPFDYEIIKNTLRLEN